MCECFYRNFTERLLCLLQGRREEHDVKKNFIIIIFFFLSLTGEALLIFKQHSWLTQYVVLSYACNLFFARYEELIRDERMTYQEIQAMERKFDAWSQLAEKPDNKSKTPAAPLASARDITKDLPPQVAAFEVTREMFINKSKVVYTFTWFLTTKETQQLV